MVVGVMEVCLVLFDNGSLKDKRSVVKRILHRCKNTFNVAAAEVDDLDATDRATLGFVVVGNDSRVLRSKLDKLEGFIESLGLAEILEAPKIIEHY